MAPTRRQVLAASLPAVGGCVGTPRVFKSATCRPPATRRDVDARLGFVGDVMLGRGVNDRWDDPDRDPAGVWTDLRDRLAGLDGLFLNLECCLSDRGDPRPGRTYHFRADPDWAVPALAAADASFASLANNHVLDFGRPAFFDTFEHLNAADVAAAGAGPDRSAALRPAVVEAGDLTVGVVALTDQVRAYAAGPTSPGTAYAPLKPSSRTARRRAGRALDRLDRHDPDLVVASLHWGYNWVVRPTDAQRAFARWLIDRGVDVVHGHSAHVIQGIETYRGRPILYDCGDFVDDYVHKPDLHNKRSFLFELLVEDGTLRAVALSPVRIADAAVGCGSDEDAAWLRGRMRSLSAELGTTVERDGRGLVVPIDDCP